MVLMVKLTSCLDSYVRVALDNATALIFFHAFVVYMPFLK